MRYDVTLRSLLMGLPRRLVEILTGKQPLRALPTELPEVNAPRSDSVMELEDGSILHIEAPNS